MDPQQQETDHLHGQRYMTRLVPLALPTALFWSPHDRFSNPRRPEALGWQMLNVTFSSVFSNNSERGRCVHSPMSQTGTVRCHMTTVNSINVELEWTSCSRET